MLPFQPVASVTPVPNSVEVTPIAIKAATQLDSKLNLIIEEIGRERNEPNLKEDLAIAAAIVDRPNRTLSLGSFHGETAMYPASVVKLFYLAYAESLVARKKLHLTAEITRGLHDMIVDSNNDATSLILDLITGTTSGPELSPSELQNWMKRRQAVNQFFLGLGYTGVNACQKTWNEGPYGRERQGYGPHFELRNSLTPVACLRLMSEINLDAIVGPTECSSMRILLSRRIPSDSPDSDEQGREFSGRYLPKGFSLWSKAGWVTSERHDVAYIRTASGAEFALAIFTRNHGDDLKLIGDIAQRILHAFGGL